jgi:membrane protein
LVFLRENLRRLDVRTLAPPQRAVVRAVQFVILLWEQFSRDKVVIRASGLAYSSLLAAVPLIAVIFAVLSAFGALDEIKINVQEFLLTNLLPTRQDEIVGFLDQFTSNTTKLGSLGFAFLALTAVLLLDNVESNFNDIYHLSSRRRFLSKITAYTSVLVLGTLFMGASISMSARVSAMLHAGVRLDLSWIDRQLSWLFPLLLAFLAFLVAYTVIPYTRVRLKSAVVGATISAVLFELAKHFFATSVGQSVRYSAIYGSLAVIPIFLIWLYMTWIVVLLGLEVVFTHQHFLTLLRSRVIRGGPERDNVGTGLRLFTLVAQRFDAGQEPPTCDELSRRLLVPVGAVEARVERLVETGLVRRVALGSDTLGIVPATAPDKVMVSEVMGAFEPQIIEAGPHAQIEKTVNDLMTEFLRAGHERVADTSFADVLARAAGGGTADASDS